APAKSISAVPRLRVHRRFGKRAGPVGERLQGAAVKIAWRWRLCQVEHRRNDVGELHDVGDAPSRAKSGRLFQDEWDVDVLVVQEQPVLLLPVVAESLSVIRHEDDRGLIVELMLLEIPEESAE